MRAFSESPLEPTTLVLLPGLDGTGLLFDTFIAQLPPQITPLVVRAIPGAQLVWINAPHLILQVAPRDAAEHIARFLSVATAQRSDASSSR